MDDGHYGFVKNPFVFLAAYWSLLQLCGPSIKSQGKLIQAN